MRECWSLAIAGLLVVSAVAIPAGLEASVPGSTPPAERLIVGLRADPDTAPATDTAGGANPRDRVRTLMQRRGLGLRATRSLGARMAVVVLAEPREGNALTDLLHDLESDPDVEFAAVDHRRFARAVPSDPLFSSQWYLQDSEVSGANFVAAWDITTGMTDTVIAIFDTGVRFDHPDLRRTTAGGRLLPGYDFVSADGRSGAFVTANDGDGWDPDPSDPGDWVTATEAASGALRDCDVTNSTWHGTRVAGMLGAITDNGEGMAGGTWAPRLLPVRVLGKCGGFDSDIIAGMRWAAGIPVQSVPANPHPARILNLSLGAAGTCSQPYRSVINQLRDLGVLVVVSGGNDSGPVDAPANCPGVLAVAGLRHVGTKVGFSSFGTEIAVAAPAGNCPSGGLCAFSLLTTDNTGLTTPQAASYTDTFNFNIGTSFSAPIVAAIAGLMHGVNDQLTPDEFIGRIQAGARPFPPPQPGLPTCPSTDPETLQCNCTTTTCGAGMADAPGAVHEALRPMARIATPASVAGGQNITLDGTGSRAARDRSITGYGWSIVSGTADFVGSSLGSSAVLALPPTGTVRVRLEVVDDLGRRDSKDVTVGGSSSGGGGGGGSADIWLVAGLLLCPAWRRYRRRLTIYR